MKIKASGRWTLMLATGLILVLGFAGPLPAKAAGSDPATSKSDNATSGKSVRQSARHNKRTAQRSSSKTADKPAETKNAADTADAGNAVTPAGIPASIANANAQLPASDTADNASAMAAKANTILAAADNKPSGAPAADSDVVASDQLNDVDRALQQATPADAPPQPQQQAQLQVQPPQQQTVAMASAKPVLASADSSPWDQTSLIGKIFIAFGALLTVASAARMFMA